MISGQGLSHTHAFVRDRTRAVRLDLRVQMEEIEGRSITRQCVRRVHDMYGLSYLIPNTGFTHSHYTLSDISQEIGLISERKQNKSDKVRDFLA